MDTPFCAHNDDANPPHRLVDLGAFEESSSVEMMFLDVIEYRSVEEGRGGRSGGEGGREGGSEGVHGSSEGVS